MNKETIISLSVHAGCIVVSIEYLTIEGQLREMSHPRAWRPQARITHSKVSED